jgi:hypothetical protein
MNITFNILFWKGFDFQNRFDNLKFSWYRLNKFCEYAQTKNVEVKPLLFDFSEEKNLEDSIHIPYPNGEYKRSEKINRVLEYNEINYNPNLICIVDSDVFFEEDQYDKLLDIINNYDKNIVYVPTLSDIMFKSEVDFINKTIHNPKVTQRVLDGLGAFFIVNFKNIFNIGGFDERFIVWGGEDDDMRSRLINSGSKIERIPIKLFHLPHESLMTSAHKSIEYHQQVSIINNNSIKTEYSLISKKYLNECDTY